MIMLCCCLMCETEEVKEGIKAFEFDLQEPGEDESDGDDDEDADADDDDDRDVLRLRGGGGSKRKLSGEETDSKSRKKVCGTSVVDEVSSTDEMEDSSGHASGYESSSAFSTSSGDDSSIVSKEVDEVKMEVVDLVDDDEDDESYEDDTPDDDEEEDATLSDDPKNLFNIRSKFMKLAQALYLPGNPLDTLIDQLG